MVARWLAVVLALCASVVLAQDDVTVTANVDRDQPHVNESFTYILRAEGRVRGEPQIGPLEQLFDVLQASQSTRIQIVDGQAQQVAEWIYQLMPRRPGKALIPPIEVAGRFSNAVEIDVLPAETRAEVPGDIFLEAEVESESAYVQSQVVYTLRLYVGTVTGRATITPPPIVGGEAIIERLGEDRQYRANRGGREFDVRERRYAIFPQQAGTLTIGPATFEAMVIPNRGFSRVQRFRSEPIEISVEPPVPPPSSHPNAAWLPAKRLTLTERWTREPPALEVGVPTTRALMIEAEGLLETQLPELALAQAPGVRQYADRPELERRVTPDGMVATRIERYAVLPQNAGVSELPGVELPWFNVAERRWEVASVAPRRLEVAASQQSVPPAEAAPAPAAVEAPAPSEPVVVSDRGVWPAVSVLLAAGWALTLLLWWRARRAAPPAPQASTSETPKRPANRRLLKQVRSACERGDAPAARDALLEWAALRFPAAPPRTLGALAARVPEGLGRAVLDLEATLYGPDGRRTWNGAELAAALGDVDAVDRRGATTPNDPLLPLYR